MDELDPDQPATAWDASYEETEAATRRVVSRLLALSAELDEAERSVLAALFQPMLERTRAGDQDDVSGFAAGDDPYPAAIATALRDSGLRIERPGETGAG